MNIALNDWVNFKDRMARMSKIAADKMADFVTASGGYANIPTEEIIGYATALVERYGEGTGTLAAMMYDAIAELSNAAVDAAEVASVPTYGEVAKAVQGAAKTSIDPEYIGGVVGRLVKQVGADTTLMNAERDGAQFAWVPAGDTCAFCLTLASRGWQYVSKRTLKNGHAEHIHANCDCTYAVRFNDDTFIEGYDPDKYLWMYDHAPLDEWNTENGKPPKDHYGSERSTPKNRINAMRRELYADNKAKINAQKRAAYAANKESINKSRRANASQFRDFRNSILEGFEETELDFDSL